MSSKFIPAVLLFLALICSLVTAGEENKGAEQKKEQTEQVENEQPEKTQAEKGPETAKEKELPKPKAGQPSQSDQDKKPVKEQKKETGKARKPVVEGKILTAREIIDKSDEVSKLKGSEAVSTMTIFDAKGRERVRKVAQITKLYDNGNTEKKLVRFLSPADVKGTGLLTFDYKKKDDDIWLFMPALRKTRRIISTEKAKNFMGSEFSYSDMSPPVLDDFNYKRLADEKCGEEDCWKVEMIPANEKAAEENGFSKKISLIGKKDYVLRKAVYYDLNAELHKEMNVLKIKELDKANKKYRPVHLTMDNKQNGRKSVLVINKIEFSPGVKDDYFTTRYLERP